MASTTRTPVLYQFLPDQYKLITQPNDSSKRAVLTAIIKAISEQDDKNVDLLMEARKQLFLNSASGKYLIDLAAQNGFNLPQRSGLDQFGISKLAVPVINKPKQLLSTVNYLTEIVYAASTLHPSFFATQPEPYNLANGDNLTFATESNTVNIIINADSFGNITQVSASELAGYINGTQQTVVFADTFYDRSVNARRLRISGKTYGSSSRIQCVGGTAQNIIRFPDITATANTTGTNWIITKPAYYNDITTFTWDGVGVNPQTYNINIGDYCTIRGLVDIESVNFSALNGTSVVIDCGFNYFKIKTKNFLSANTTYTQNTNTEILFTKAYARTLYDNDQFALNYEPQVGRLCMSIPPIPSIVRRDLKGSAHIHGASYPVLSFNQSSVTIPYPNNLPSSGVFTLKSDKFARDYDNRYFSYTSLQAVSESAQTMSLDLNGYRNFPFFSQQAAAPMGAYTDVFYANLDSNQYEVQVPGLNLYLEHNIEFSLENIKFNRAPTPTANNIYTVNSILLPRGATSVEFTHNRNSKFLYMQFKDSLTGELLQLSYGASSVNPLNATVISYGFQAAGRVVSATMVVCQTAFPVPVNEATLALQRNISNSNGSIQVDHNMNSTNIMFMVMNASTGEIVNAERLISNANTVTFNYIRLPSANYAFLFINMDAPAIAGVDTNPLRYKNLGIVLPSNQSSVLINHSLRASNIMFEARKTSGLPYVLNNTELEFMKVTFVDQDNLRIDYLNLAANMTIDLFCVYDTQNTSTVSVDGGLTLSDINSKHIVKCTKNKDYILFEINNPDGTPKNYKGAVVGGFNIVAATDPSGNYDAYMQFNTSLSRQDARIANGTKIKLVGVGTVSSQTSVAELMRGRYLSVVSQSNDKIYLKTGVLATPGQIIAGEQCRCSTFFGGSGTFLTVDPNSAWNAANVYSNLTLTMTSCTKDPYLGSYIYDPHGVKNPYVIGGVRGIGTVQSTIQLASSPGVIYVDSVEGFNSNGGYLCLEYGSSQTEGPIRYYEVNKGSRPFIVIDKAYVFKNKHSIGIKVFNVVSIYPYTPKASAVDYPVYLTGSTNARDAFVNIIESVIASGILLKVDVQVPLLKNQEPGISIF